jgi:hypothetical protein
MFGFRIFWRILLALILVGLLVGGGVTAYRTGWAQGYQAGVLTAADTGEALPRSSLVPAYPFYPGWGHYGPFFGFTPFSPFLWIGFFLLLFFVIGGLFRPWGWPRSGGWGGHMHGGWRHGPMPPWAREWEERYKQWSEEKEQGTESPPSG